LEIKTVSTPYNKRKKFMISKSHMILAGIVLLALVGCGQDEIETKQQIK
jgi:hypothetical protein